ncbi:MAG: LiaI-LiaF-like domain-containing protein [Candidatus Omnitrophota bacterium]
MSRRKQEYLFWGIILLVIGVLFMLDNLGVDISLWDILATYWPLILIAIGAKNIWMHFSAKKNKE